MHASLVQEAAVGAYCRVLVGENEVAGARELRPRGLVSHSQADIVVRCTKLGIPNVPFCVIIWRIPTDRQILLDLRL